MTRTPPTGREPGKATPGHDDLVRCSCGLAFPGPWNLTGHFLEVYPPHVGQPPGVRHADATRLAVKLAEGPTEAWEAATWARDVRRHLRVAAAIAMRSTTGDLKPWARVTQRQLAGAYRVPASVARNAIAELTVAGILGHYGGGTTVVARTSSAAMTGPTGSGRADARSCALKMLQSYKQVKDVSGWADFQVLRRGQPAPQALVKFAFSVQRYD